jgi:chemotaxis protein MotB
MVDETALRDRLAAALAAQVEAEAGVTDAERDARLLAQANASLQEEEAKSAEGLRRIAVLNEQIAAMRNQLGSLQALLDQSTAEDLAAQVQLEALGSQLNTALARVASEQRRRAELEEAERRRLEAETEDLERFRSEFFGQLRDLIGNREGVQIVGDRFLFSSEVLFEIGSADLAAAGRTQISEVAGILSEVADQIPGQIDWILRVDGHTDDIPITGGVYADNWELSQARALSVVRYMIANLGFPPGRLAPTGFGEFRPVNTEDSDVARAQNRRIELKLTER